MKSLQLWTFHMRLNVVWGGIKIVRMRDMKWILILPTLLFSLSSLAKDICLNDLEYTIQVTEKGITEVHPAVLCWEEAYYVRDLAKRIPKNSIMKFEDPYMVYTNQRTGKSEQFSLLDYDTHFLCYALGYASHIKTEESTTIFPVQLVKRSFRKPISKKNFEIFPRRRKDYVEAIYCAQEYIDLEDLAREHLPLVERHNPRIRVNPLGLFDQNKIL